MRVTNWFILIPTTLSLAAMVATTNAGPVVIKVHDPKENLPQVPKTTLEQYDPGKRYQIQSLGGKELEDGHHTDVTNNADIIELTIHDDVVHSGDGDQVFSIDSGNIYTRELQLK